MLVDVFFKLNHYIYNALNQIKLEEELKKLTLDNFKIEELSNQTHESDLIYNLSKLKLYKKNDELSSLLSKLIKKDGSKTNFYDITDYYGSMHGKSDCYKNLDEFSQKALKKEYHSPRRICFQTNQDWIKNTNSIKKELKTREYAIKSYLFLWNERKFFDGINCAHRIAAIYRQASEQGRNFTIECEHLSLDIDNQIRYELEKNYYCFIVSKLDSYTEYSLFSLQCFLDKINNNDTFVAFSSELQTFEKCQTYQYFFIKRNTWATKILSSYFYDKISCGKAVSLSILF